MNANKILVPALMLIASVGASTPAVFAQQAGQGAAVQTEQPETTPSRVGVWGDIVYGSETAPVELIKYGSLTCPHCASFSKDVLPRLMEDFISGGQLKFVFRNFVRDRYDLAAAAASRCFDTTDATKRALEVMFAEQDTWMRSNNPYEGIAQIVEREGMNRDEMGACISDQQVREHLVQMTQGGAQKYNIQAIPTLVLNGVAMTFPGYDRLKLRIETQIATQALTQN